MRDFTDYKKSMENEVAEFKSQINPTLNNSAKKASERITQFLETLPKVEKHMDDYCKKYFEGETISSQEMEELKSLNTKIYQDFINYCKIPGISKNE